MKRLFALIHIFAVTLFISFACGVLAVATSTTPRCGNSEHCQTKEVNSYPTGASPYGALNMAGNVWEWVADWYEADYYSQAPSDNPKGPANGDFRVIRGAARQASPKTCA